MSRSIVIAITALMTSAAGASAADPPRRSALYPAHVLQRVRANLERDDWGRDLAKRVIEAAEPWHRMSDEELRGLMFGATLPRSWMVWSNGHCPACKEPVPMYDWKIDALKAPWKLRCPRCEAYFPTNDFKKFYDSGLDERGVFDPARADRALLFNAEHPDPADPLHRFGVDDGQGYVEGGNRWRFISTYLVFGQWKQAVLGGVKRLATAYVLSGDARYGEQAGVMLQRVAELYTTFDFKTQGILYESVRGDGYVSVWHDACIETRELATAYDAVKPALTAEACDVIERGILRDALANQHKVYSNFPQQHLTLAVIQTALDWPANRDAVLATLAPVLDQSTAVDGTTGEKGLANYSAYAAQRLGEFLGYYTRIDDEFLPELVRRHPRLPEMYRFFIDTWCLERYYPLSGDTGWFAGPQPNYGGVAFSKHHALETAGHANSILAPSMYSLLWQMYKLTGDAAFVQVLYKANDGATEGLPYDLFLDSPPQMQADVRSVIDAHGPALKLASMNKEQWRLAILRSGKGENARAVWLDYDSGGQHGHADGMNLGLFARGLDLMPDFGYPSVQFGGWSSPRAQWYTTTAAHNTVLVNGVNQAPGNGHTTLWAAGDGFSAISASAPGMGGATQFERTVALIDVSPEDAYVLDVFRVTSGGDHAKFFISHFGNIEAADLKLEPAADYAHPQMRDFRAARNAAPGWSVEWHIDDRYKLLATETQVRLRYTDFTIGADAYTCQAWVSPGTYHGTPAEAWLPRILVRRRGPAPLASTFVSLIEPHGGRPPIARATRLPLQLSGGGEAPDSSVALQIDLSDGRRDLLICNESSGMTVTEPQSGLTVTARLCLVRADAEGKVHMIALCHGSAVTLGDNVLALEEAIDFVQVRAEPHVRPKIIHGPANRVKQLRLHGP